MLGRWIVSGFVVAVFISVSTLQAQLPRPLGPRPDSGLRVAPFFDGWYANPDGTISFSFGYSNLNKATVEIPLGPNNFIEPKQYDGLQPTSFIAVEPADPTGRGSGRGPNPNAAGGPDAAGGGRGGGGGTNYERQRGVFTVTVPGDFKGDVVWTLRYQGQTWSIPARATSTAYQLSWPMAMWSVPPLLRFQTNGRAGRGPTGIQGPPLQAKVGAPLQLVAWLTDDAVHEKEPIPVKREIVPSMNVTWFKHAGPASPVVFNPPRGGVTDPEGRATTTATFNESGEYVIRVRADAHGNLDSSASDQCCWTNGYWKVVVTQ